jgi:hypothetical protein
MTVFEDVLAKLITTGGLTDRNSEAWTVKDESLPELQRIAKLKDFVPESGSLVNTGPTEGTGVVIGPMARSCRLGNKSLGMPYWGLPIDTLVGVLNGDDLLIVGMPSIMCQPIEAAEDAKDRIAKTAELVRRYKNKHSFKAGDIIQWKEGLRNKKQLGKLVFLRRAETPVYRLEVELEGELDADYLDCIVLCTIRDEPAPFLMASDRLEPVNS